MLFVVLLFLNEYSSETDMENLLNIIDSAKWCTEFDCGKCRCLTRNKIVRLRNLQNELEQIDLTNIRIFSDLKFLFTMGIVFQFFGEEFDWEQLEKNWLKKQSYDYDSLSSLFEFIAGYCCENTERKLWSILER